MAGAQPSGMMSGWGSYLWRNVFRPYTAILLVMSPQSVMCCHLSAPMTSQLQRRLSRQASEQPRGLEIMLQDVSRTDASDDRSCFLADSNQRLMAGMIYRASTRGDDTCPAFQFVWKNFATPRVRFFGWLLTKNRINCRSSLLKKNIIEEDTCAICRQAPETADHIISGCPFTQAFWNAIGWQAGQIAGVQCLWETSAPVQLPRSAHSSLLLLICWEIWKHRHDVVFRAMPPDLSRLIAACRESAKMWRCRLLTSKKKIFESTN